MLFKYKTELCIFKNNVFRFWFVISEGYLLCYDNPFSDVVINKTCLHGYQVKADVGNPAKAKLRFLLEKKV